MRLQWGLFLLFILMIMVAGCSTTQKMKNPVIPSTPVPQLTPTPISPPQYQIGDIVVPRSESDTGFVVLDYNIGNGLYKVRFVFFDDFGKLYFVNYKGEEWIGRAALEQGYPYRSGRIDNPYAITVNQWIKKPKFSYGDIVTVPGDPLQGLLVFEFNPKTDSYRIRYVEYTNYQWKYTGFTTTYWNRADLESKYSGTVYRVNPNALPDPNPRGS
jgi:hypothetical protein